MKDPRACSEHFVSDNFQRDLKYELLYPGSPMPVSKVKLSDTACPSKNIPSSHPARYVSIEALWVYKLEVKFNFQKCLSCEVGLILQHSHTANMATVSTVSQTHQLQ